MTVLTAGRSTVVADAVGRRATLADLTVKEMRARIVLTTVNALVQRVPVGGCRHCVPDAMIAVVVALGTVQTVLISLGRTLLPLPRRRADHDGHDVPGSW